MCERVCVIVQEQAGKYARKRDRGGEIKRERENKRETVCRIGVLDIQTDSIHLSLPGVLMGSLSLLAGKPLAKHILSLFCIQTAYLCINTSHFSLHG